MRITRGNESILQEQPLVIVRAVADEHLLVLSTPGSCSDFITVSFLVKSCFYLERKIIKRFFFKRKSKTKKMKLLYQLKPDVAFKHPSLNLTTCGPNATSALCLCSPRLHPTGEGGSPAQGSEDSRTHTT